MAVWIASMVAKMPFSIFHSHITATWPHLCKTATFGWKRNPTYGLFTTRGSNQDTKTEKIIPITRSAKSQCYYGITTWRIYVKKCHLRTKMLKLSSAFICHLNFCCWPYFSFSTLKRLISVNVNNERVCYFCTLILGVGFILLLLRFWMRFS